MYALCKKNDMKIDKMVVIIFNMQKNGQNMGL